MVYGILMGSRWVTVAKCGERHGKSAAHAEVPRQVEETPYLKGPGRCLTPSLTC